MASALNMNVVQENQSINVNGDTSNIIEGIRLHGNEHEIMEVSEEFICKTSSPPTEERLLSNLENQASHQYQRQTSSPSFSPHLTQKISKSGKKSG